MSRESKLLCAKRKDVRGELWAWKLVTPSADNSCLVAYCLPVRLRMNMGSAVGGATRAGTEASRAHEEGSEKGSARDPAPRKVIRAAAVDY